MSMPDIFTDPDGWHKEWHRQRNEMVAKLVALSAPTEGLPKDATRADFDNDRMRWVFWFIANRHHHLDTAETTLYEAVTSAIRFARDDERARIAKAISNGLRVLLGDEFVPIMYDIAQANEINIGRD